MNGESPAIPQPLNRLDGASITRWLGSEMAFDGGNAVITDETVITGFASDSPAIWAHADVPFGQFSSIYLETADGLHFHLVSDDADDRMNGLLLVRTVQAAEPFLGIPGSLLRTRLLDLPTGKAKLSVHREGPGGAVVDASLKIGGQVIRLLCGEVYPLQDGSFELVSPGESDLVQVNGVRP